MTESNFYHAPVLKDEVIQLLITDPKGIYLDCTLGGGGHFRAIAAKLDTEATLIGVDRDPDAIKWNLEHPVSSGAQVIIEQSKFSGFDQVLQKNNISEVNGILLDLGVSSWQIDSSERGFSYMGESPLDMRMNQQEGISADEYIQSKSEDELSKVLAEFGEVQNARRMAHTLKVCSFPLKTAADLRNCLSAEYGPNIKYKVLSKVFQALRIAINDELGELKCFLSKALEHLKPQGRLAVMSYHSLEDRLVKEFLRSAEKGCDCPVGLPVCVCHKKPLFKRITRKSIQASEEEVKINPRSRSVRLRVAEKI